MGETAQKKVYQAVFIPMFDHCIYCILCLFDGFCFEVIVKVQVKCRGVAMHRMNIGNGRCLFVNCLWEIKVTLLSNELQLYQRQIGHKH